MNGRSGDLEQRLLDLACDIPAINRDAQAWFLEQGPGVAPALAAALEDRRLGSICHRRILLLLRQFAQEQTLPAILAALDRGDPIVRPGAMEAAAVFKVPGATDALAALLRNPDADVARHAAALLGQSGAPRAVEPLAALLDHEDPSRRRAAAEALGEIGSPAASEALRRYRAQEAGEETRARATDKFPAQSGPGVDRNSGKPT